MYGDGGAGVLGPVPASPGVLVPEAEGLTSLEPGKESPEGPTTNLGGSLGWLVTPVASELCLACGAAGRLMCDGFFLSSSVVDKDVGGVSWGGDTSGVMMFESCESLLLAGAGLDLLSLDWVAAGVSGGECIVEVGGEGLGDGAPENAMGVREPDEGEGAYKYGSACGTKAESFAESLTLDAGNETGSKEKFSSLFDWRRELCSVEARLRSSSCASGPSCSLGFSSAPVNVSTCWRACSGSISSLCEANRTPW